MPTFAHPKHGLGNHRSVQLSYGVDTAAGQKQAVSDGQPHTQPTPGVTATLQTSTPPSADAPLSGCAVGEIVEVDGAFFEVTPPRELPDYGPTVYAVRADNGLIKIGFSSNLRRRARQLQTASGRGVQCIAFAVGGKAEEARLHLRLKGSHERGEWFRPTKEVLSALADLDASLRGAA